jgi:hypothetical protein
MFGTMPFPFRFIHPIRKCWWWWWLSYCRSNEWCHLTFVEVLVVGEYLISYLVGIFEVVPRNHIDIISEDSRQGIGMRFHANGTLYIDRYKVLGGGCGTIVEVNVSGGWVCMCHRTIHKFDDICPTRISLFYNIEHWVLEPRRIRPGFSYDP